MKLSKSFIYDICNASTNSFYFSLTLNIILIIVILISLTNLEKSKCKCSDIPNKRFLKEWFIFLIIIQGLTIFFFMIGKEPCYARFLNNYSIYFIMLIIGFINFIMLFRLFLYVRILRNNCPCGYGNLEKFLFWYLIIAFSIIAFAITLLLILGISTYFIFSGMKANIKK